MTRGGDGLVVAAAALTGVLVGAAIVATRFVIDETTPAALAMMRYVIGFLCLLPALLIATRVRFRRRDLLPIALLGIAQFGILVALLNFGLKTVPASRVALIFATFPVFTMILAALMGRESMTLAKTLGVFLTLVGVALALGEDAWRIDDADIEWIGVAAVFASAICGAMCSVLYGPYLDRYPAVPMSAFAMLASVGFLAVLAGVEGFFSAPPQISTGGWLAIAFIGISSGIGYFLLLWALAHTTPTLVTMFLALSPVTAVLLGVTLLGERMSLHLLAGVILVVAGLWVALAPLKPSPSNRSSADGMRRTGNRSSLPGQPDKSPRRDLSKVTRSSR